MSVPQPEAELTGNPRWLWSWFAGQMHMRKPRKHKLLWHGPLIRRYWAPSSDSNPRGVLISSDQRPNHRGFGINSAWLYVFFLPKLCPFRFVGENPAIVL